jgi:hypothetical protein
MMNMTKEAMKNAAKEIIKEVYVNHRYKDCTVVTSHGSIYTAKRYGQLVFEVYEMIDPRPEDFQDEDEFCEMLEDLYVDDARFFRNEVK